MSLFSIRFHINVSEPDGGHECVSIFFFCIIYCIIYFIGLIVVVSRLEKGPPPPPTPPTHPKVSRLTYFCYFIIF